MTKIFFVSDLQAHRHGCYLSLSLIQYFLDCLHIIKRHLVSRYLLSKIVKWAITLWFEFKYINVLKKTSSISVGNAPGLICTQAPFFLYTNPQLLKNCKWKIRESMHSFFPHGLQKFVIQRTAELELLIVFNGTSFIFLFPLTLFKFLPWVMKTSGTCSMAWCDTA